MPTATLTSKGQITIPAEIREALGLTAGDKIDFFEFESGKYAMKPKTRSIKELRGCVPRLDHVVTIEEMNQAVLEHAAELDAATRSETNQRITDGEAA